MPRFVVDGMLGRFTRWLRILGCEVKYFNQASDERLLEIAEEEGRVLLTRDLELYGRAKARGLEALFIEETTNPERIAEVAGRYNIRLEVDSLISRCPSCGSRIRRVGKEEVLGSVPEGTLRRYKDFWLCLGCGKAYWRGSHWKRINETFKKAKKLLEERSGGG